MRKLFVFLLVASLTLSVSLQTTLVKAADKPLAEKYLLDGKLADGAKALEARLKVSPKDDQARFGLGMTQFLQTFEHIGGNLYKYGLRTEKSFLHPPAQVKEFLPQNPHPETISYKALRQVVQTCIDDLNKAEATLAEVKDPDVKLPLHVGLIKIDPFGQGKPISAAFLFERRGNVEPLIEGLPENSAEQAKTLVIGFDRGDVSWLRGYCHFMAASGEMLLAVDGQHSFECTAHLFFEKVETPHTFLLEDRRAFDGPDMLENRPAITDAISFIHQWMRLTIKEPERMKAALAHMEAGIGQAKEMWKYIRAETDDDNEWIPNPKQTGVLGVKVTNEMIDTWIETLDEAEQVLAGKKLVPFWRGKGEQGINIRRVLLEVRTIDPIEWVQGTAATPYLEKGTTTKFADPKMVERLDKAFGGMDNFAAFGFWFN